MGDCRDGARHDYRITQVGGRGRQIIACAPARPRLNPAGAQRRAPMRLSAGAFRP